jgi:hypothetical protein
MLLLAAIASLAFSLFHLTLPESAQFGEESLHASPPIPSTDAGVVFLANGLAETDLISFTANMAASGHPGVALVDGPKCRKGVHAFLAAAQYKQVIPVGTCTENKDELKQRLNVEVARTQPWQHGPSRELWKMWFPRAEQVVVCRAEPRRLLLQAACLAGALCAPLWILQGNADSVSDLMPMLAEWRTRRVLAVGLPDNFGRDLAKVHVLHLPDEEAVTSLAWSQMEPHGTVQTLAVANPADSRKELHGMSVLAPYLAIQHRAALLLTSDTGDDTASLVREALANPRLARADNLLFVADLTAIPLERRANPVAGKDAFIEMEPLTPIGSEPFTFATGRLFHEDPGIVLLMMARQRLLEHNQSHASRKVLVASNPGGSLPLLEMFSRNTVWELRNCGYEITALFGDDVTKDSVRKQMPLHDIFLWEGHHNTLVKEWHFPDWKEPLPPSLIFLQSCLALTDVKTHPLLERGAVAVIGSSTRTYSGTGGAFSLAYFNALLYDQQSLGGGLRQAKNFLLAYSLLKQKRLGKDAKLTGANLRSAWAFTLWGDPTLKLPAPPCPVEALPAVRHEVHGNTVVLTLPDIACDKVSTPQYQCHRRPNTCLAGLLSKEQTQESKKQLVPFVFVEVALPKVPANQTPRLHSRLPSSHYVFCWDQRRHCGYLLVTPRPRDRKELRFHIDWDTVDNHGNASNLVSSAP